MASDSQADEPSCITRVTRHFTKGEVTDTYYGRNLMSELIDLEIERDQLRWERDELRHAMPYWNHYKDIEQLVRKIIFVNRDDEQPTTSLGALQAQTRRQHIETQAWKAIRTMITEHDEELRAKEASDD